MSKKITVVEINENTTYDDVVNHIVEEEKVEEPQTVPVEEKEASGLEPLIKPKPKRTPRKKVVKNSEVEEGEIIPPTEPVRMKRTLSKIAESVEKPVEVAIEEAIVEVPIDKPKAKRAPRKKAIVEKPVEVAIEESIVEVPIVKPKAKRTPRKKVVNEIVREVVEETKPVRNVEAVEIPIIAPRKSRAVAKVELYEKLALNALP